MISIPLSAILRTWQKKRIFKTKAFSKWFNKSDLSDTDLLVAVKEIEKGLYEADLGGNIYKKRVAIGNRGKSRGARTIVATKLSEHWFFIFAFTKNERAKSTMLNLQIYKRLLKYCLVYQAMKLIS